jgi:phage baseplate assembly protein W
MYDLRVFVQEDEFIIAGVGRRSTAVQAEGKLIQIVTKCLLTTPGRDIFDPDWGAGIRSILPATATVETEKLPMPELNIAISKAERDIRESQQNARMTPEEMLHSLILIDLRFNQEKLRWELDLAVKSRAGIVTTVTVGT